MQVKYTAAQLMLNTKFTLKYFTPADAKAKRTLPLPSCF